MKSIRKLTALLCAAVLFFSSCAGNVPEETDPTAEAPVTEAPDPGFPITADYVIVRPDDTDETEVLAMQLVSRCLQQVYGLRLTLTTDWTRDEANLKPAAHEILIGITNRPQSRELTAGFHGTEGAYRIYGEDVIAIAGGSPDATLAAACAFLKDIFGYEESDQKRVISEGTPALLHAGEAVPVSVSFPTVYLNGADLRTYCIVASFDNKGLSDFLRAIQDLCGDRLPVCKPEEYKGGPVIYVGMTADGADRPGRFYDSYTYYTEANGVTVSVDFQGTAIASRVLLDFAAEYLPQTALTAVDATVPAEERMHIAVTGEENGLYLVSSDEKELAPGVTYTSCLYRDRKEAPVQVCAVTVAPGAARLYAGTPDDAHPVSGTVSTVMNEMNAAKNHGKNVVAGFNASFFDMGGTGLSRGLCIKDGEPMAANSSRPFIAALRDGTNVILPASGYASYADRIYNAVSGNVILLKNGKISDIAPGTDMAVTRHPRTAAGLRPDGTVVILEVDGRQPAYSNGASYCDLVRLFRDFGCTEAINLDGGGSSTCIIRGADGKFALQNHPSDGSMRKVQDSLLVVLP